MGSGVNITHNLFVSPLSPFSLLPMSAPHTLQAINMGTHWYSPPPHTASHEQPQTWCLVALVGVFAAPPLVLLPSWQVHQDLGLIDTHFFHMLPLTNNPRLDVSLLHWEWLLPLSWCFFQCGQFHGVIKKHLKSSIQGINRALLDKLAACGDINRFTLRSNCYKVGSQDWPLCHQECPLLIDPNIVKFTHSGACICQGCQCVQDEPGCDFKMVLWEIIIWFRSCYGECERVGELHIFLLSLPADLISSIYQNSLTRLRISGRRTAYGMAQSSCEWPVALMAVLGHMSLVRDNFLSVKHEEPIWFYSEAVTTGGN